MRPYWRRKGEDSAEIFRAAEREYRDITARCEAFKKIVEYLTAVGRAAYATLGSLSYRQCLATHALCVDLDGTPLHMSEENFPNSNIATVDVTYPAAPFFSLYNPTLPKAQVQPILEYAQTNR